MGLTLTGKNLLKDEQILFFKSRSHFEDLCYPGKSKLNVVKAANFVKLQKDMGLSPFAKELLLFFLSP